MANPVVHFELIGPDPKALRGFYAGLFDWQAPGAPVAPEVSDPDNYGFIERSSTPDGTGIPGGIGGGEGYQAHAVFYVGVEDVEAALSECRRTTWWHARAGAGVERGGRCGGRAFHRPGRESRRRRRTAMNRHQ